MYSTKVSFFIFLLFTVYFFSCSNNDSKQLTVQDLEYDTSRIQLFHKNQLNTAFPNNTSPLTLIQEDLWLIDSLLKDAIDSFNTHISPLLMQAFSSKVSIDSLIIHPKKYKLQYFPYVDVNGQKTVNIIGFSANFPLWRAKVYQPPIPYGLKQFTLHINLSDITRGNLITGYFG